MENRRLGEGEGEESTTLTMVTGVMAVRSTKDTEDAEEGATTKTELRGRRRCSRLVGAEGDGP